MPASNESARMIRVTGRAYTARCSAARPAEFAPPTSTTVARRLRRRGAVEDAAADEPLDAGGLQVAVGDAGGDDARAAAEPAVAAEAQLEGAVRARSGVDDLDADHELGAEARCLLVRAAGQLCAGDALREAGYGDSAGLRPWTPSVTRAPCRSPQDAGTADVAALPGHMAGDNLNPPGRRRAAARR